LPSKQGGVVNFFERIEAIRTRWDVLHHPFYERWSCGELTRAELAYYAGEYRHATVALAEAAATAARHADPELRPPLERHAAEEAAHVGLWDEFAQALEAPTDRPRPETAECAAEWTSADDLLEGLVTLYAVESGQPEISRTKLEGLAEHYGFAEESPGTAYFRLHAELDQAHAAQSRALLETRVGGEEERLLDRVERTLAANWTLLDGVERQFGRALSAV
jgi:pyrroloquinoline-quinone synthase